MGPKGRSARRDSRRKSLARPSDPMQELKCIQHYDPEHMFKLNQKRLQTKYCDVCLSCVLKDLKHYGSEEKTERKKNKSARRAAAKERTKPNSSAAWVCLECGSHYCGGAGFEPEGHVRAHHNANPEHRWFAHIYNIDVLYCCECNQAIPFKVLKHCLSQNKGTAKSAEASTELGPNTNTFDPKDNDDGLDKKGVVTPQMEPLEVEGKGSSSSSSPHSEDDDGLDKEEVVTPQMKPVKAEGKGSSSPSSPHSEDITNEPVSICQPEETTKEEVAKYNVISGQPNTGNTCFFNAMLQCLLALDPLRSIMMGRNVCTGPIAALFKELFVDTSASSNGKDSLDQRKLFKSVCLRWTQFSTGRMEDAEELIQQFLHGLNEEEDEARQPSMGASKKVTVVNSIFAGEESSALFSTECVHSSENPVPTLLFRLPIPDKKLLAVASRSNKADAEVHDGDDHVSIEDCFSLYTEKEYIPDWLCESCTDTANTNTSETKPVVESGGEDNQNSQKQKTTKVYRAAKKRLLITKAPDVMVVSLIRHQKAPNRDGYVKLEGHVRFKEFFDMQPYMDKRFDENDNNTYRLVGVAQHIGDRKGGHYIAYVRASKMNGQEHQSNDKSWFYASDKIIREASLQEVFDCEAYILFYEWCSTHEAQSSSANVTSEEPRLDGINLLPMMPNLAGDLIPPPIDELVPWDEQRNPSWDKRREQEADKKNATLLPLFWEFLDEFTLSGEKMAYYRFQLWGMLVRGSGSRELHILYSHLVSQSKDLAMGVCNGGERLRVKLTEIARNYMLELVTSLKLKLTECDRNLIQQLELKFLEMPKRHEKLEACLDAAKLLREMHVHGHVEKQIMIPLPDKCVLVQGLLEHVISKHKAGYSWEGDFGINDMDAYDGKVVITKSPKIFEIQPEISPEMVTAMEKDFESIARKVLHKFMQSKIYVPYLSPFHSFLSKMGQYSKWWSDRVMTKDLRELILHYPFHKPLRARLNLLVGIFDAWRSFDRDDLSPLFKKVLEVQGHLWLSKMNKVLNQIILDVFDYKGAGYYEEALHYMIELFRHLAVHGTEKSFDYKLGDGPRKKLMQNLDELEVGGAFYLEEYVVLALTSLLEQSAMKDMLESVWECYKNCNYSYPK